MNDIEPPLDDRRDANDPPGDAAGHEALPSARGYSLASLFLLVTAAGVVAGLARNIGQTQTGSVMLLIHACVGAVLGFLAGAIIGLGYPRRARGMLLGSFVGSLTGGICAALAAAGGSPWLFFLGAAALLALGLAARSIHRHDAMR